MTWGSANPAIGPTYNIRRVIELGEATISENPYKMPRQFEILDPLTEEAQMDEYLFSISNAPAGK